MHYTNKLLVAALTAATVLAFAVGGASARNLSVNERNFELIWDNALSACPARDGPSAFPPTATPAR